MSRGSFHSKPYGNPPPRRPVKVLFDPAAEDAQLFDTLAEEQADELSINSAQLRRFFGEIKDLYRQYNALVATAPDDEARLKLYRERIEPRFKMVRSKVSYATRAGGQTKVPQEFADFLEKGIAKVTDHNAFRKFVLHLEAVVGFMYGKGRVEGR